jgi:hypothetical protein
MVIASIFAATLEKFKTRQLSIFKCRHGSGSKNPVLVIQEVFNSLTSPQNATSDLLHPCLSLIDLGGGVMAVIFA